MEKILSAILIPLPRIFRIFRLEEKKVERLVCSAEAEDCVVKSLPSSSSKIHRFGINCVGCGGRGFSLNFFVVPKNSFLLPLPGAHLIELLVI